MKMIIETKLVFLYRDEDIQYKNGLICSVNSLPHDEFFTFYVHNSMWDGVYYQEYVYIPYCEYGGKYDDKHDHLAVDKYNVEWDLTKIPDWAKEYVDAIVTHDKQKYKECQAGVYYQ